MDWIWALVALSIIGVIFWAFSAGKQAERNRARRNQLEEWKGVMDVKTSVKSDLSDPDERRRVRDRYNQTK